MRRVTATLGLRIILFVCCVSLAAEASSGDRAPVYQACVHNCELDQCTSGFSRDFPLALRLNQWSCVDNCKYECMHAITDKSIQDGQQIEQYHGKWPFVRYAGMQEPMSVAFSLMNLWVHWRGLRAVRRGIHNGHPMKPYYVTWAYVSINAWVWSSVFHTRDKSFTEKMDYFSAAAAILYGLHAAVIRLFHLYPRVTRIRLSSTTTSRTTTTRSPLLIIWTLVCVGVYLCHIAYLILLPRFDYAYNMAFNVGLGLTHNFLWALYSLPPSLPFIKRFPHYPHTYRPAYANKPLMFVLLTTAATTLELFDFPPWRQMIDAHALWHLSTVPIAVYWYDFLIQDARDDAWRAELKV